MLRKIYVACFFLLVCNRTAFSAQWTEDPVQNAVLVSAALQATEGKKYVDGQYKLVKIMVYLPSTEEERWEVGSQEVKKKKREIMQIDWYETDFEVYREGQMIARPGFYSSQDHRFKVSILPQMIRQEPNRLEFLLHWTGDFSRSWRVSIDKEGKRNFPQNSYDCNVTVTKEFKENLEQYDPFGTWQSVNNMSLPFNVFYSY